MSSFRSRRRGRVHVQLPVFGARLLADLVRQLIELLSDGKPTGGQSDDPLERMLAFGGPSEPPDDPALLRLLPDAHRDDAEASAEFRRFTEQSLRESKIAAAEQVLAGIGELPEPSSEGDDPSGVIECELTPEQARAWMRCITDLRLTLASRLGVEADDEERWAQLPEDDARGPLYRIYGWLGYQLEELIDAVQH